MSDLPSTPEGMVAMMRGRSVSESPFAMYVGIDLVRCWEGEAEAVIPVRKDLMQHFGSVHGGVLGVAADNVSCWAAASVIGQLVTSSYLIHFHAPARGQFVRAFARVVKANKRSAVVNAEIFSEQDGARELVATATTTVLARSEHQVAAS